MPGISRVNPVAQRARAGVLLAALLLLAGAVGDARGQGPGSLPQTGEEVPELAAVDEALGRFMEDHGITAGLVGVMKDGVVVYERGFGWQDAGLQTALLPTAMMRLASVTKPITAAAIHALVRQGAMSLDDHAFDLGQPGGGLLSLAPFPALGDPRLADVTVRHLLDHKGGWDRSIAGDLTYREISISLAMGLRSTPGRVNTARYIMGQPLQHPPGTTYAYSNVGYLLLGLIVEAASGVDLMDFVHAHVLQPIGVPAREVELGRTFPADRNPREPWYESVYFGPNVFDPRGPLVRRPDGSWDHEARVGQGGMIASTRALLYFLQRYYIAGPSIGALRTHDEPPGWRRNHAGSLPGTNAVARQRGDGVNFVVLFNERPEPAFGDGSDFATRIRDTLDVVLDGIVTWPNPASETWPWAASRMIRGNHPNPVRTETAIRFEVEEAGWVRIDVFDVMGRLVTTLVSREHAAGQHVITWDARGASEGVYICRMLSGGRTETTKLLVTR